MVKFFLLIFASALLSTKLFSQSLLWKISGSFTEASVAILINSNDDIFVVTFASCISLSTDGDVNWAYQPIVAGTIKNAILTKDESKIILFGYTSDIFGLKPFIASVDTSNGSLVASTYIDSIIMDDFDQFNGFSLVEDTIGNFFTAYKSGSKMIVMKFDSNLNFVTEKILPYSGWNDNYQMLYTKTGKLLLKETENSYSEEIIRSIDFENNIFNWILSIPSREDAIFSEGLNNEYFFAGGKKDGIVNPYMCKVIDHDTSAQLIWEKELDANYGHFFSCNYDSIADAVLALANYPYPSAGDLLVAKFLSSDGTIVWEKKYTLEKTLAADATIDKLGNIYATGLYHSSTSTTGSDIFLASYDATGEPSFQYYDGYCGGNDGGELIAIDGENNIIICGHSAEWCSAPNYLTILKYQGQIATFEENDISNADCEIKLIPNPIHLSTTINFCGNDILLDGTIELRNTLGKVIKTIVKNKNENYKNIEMENLESGLYILSIFLGTKKPVTFKLIKSI